MLCRTSQHARSFYLTGGVHENAKTCMLMPRWQIHEVLADPEGLEPSTLDLEGPCSIQLSYGSAFGAVMAKDGR